MLTPTRTLNVYDHGSIDRQRYRLTQGREGSVFSDTPPSARRAGPPGRRPQTREDPQRLQRTSTTQTLRRIAYAAKLSLVKRVFFAWALWADRQSRARTLARRVQLQASLRVAKDCFLRWQRLAQAALAWATAYAAAEALEKANTARLRRWLFSRWCARTALSGELRRIAEALRERNRVCAARSCFLLWMRGRRRKEQHRAVAMLLLGHVTSLARRFFAFWLVRGVQRRLLLPLQANNERVMLRRFFGEWQRWASVRRSLRSVVNKGLWSLSQCYFQRWERYRWRRSAARDLEGINARRCVRPLFGEWSWQAQLQLLRYDRHVALAGLPNL